MSEASQVKSLITCGEDVVDVLEWVSEAIDSLLPADETDWSDEEWNLDWAQQNLKEIINEARGIV